MEALALIVLIATALFYLGSRAKITSWLWSRYPPAFARFMDCAACTGFWHGLGLALVFDRVTTLPPPFGLTTPSGPLAIGLMTLVLVPIAAGWMQRGLESVGAAVE